MTEYQPVDNAQHEGDDFSEFYRPLRVLLYGSNFAAIDDAEACGISASGPNAVQTLASRLLHAGYDPDRPLIFFRANQRIGKSTISQAAQNGDLND